MRYTNADMEKVPEKIRELIRENFDQEKKVLRKGIFLYGPTGTGKTYALYAIAKRANSIGMKDVSIVENWVEMLAEMRNNLGHSLDQVIALTEKKLVFIDDIGAEKHTEWSEENLYLIVNRIYTYEKIPILATNLSLEAFQEQYGDRIMSRVAEMCELVELTGEDKRLEK